jgi:DNA-binding response OmpR family regulator
MGRTLHILIVEDDRMTRQGLGEYLSSKGYLQSFIQKAPMGIFYE